MPAPDVTPDSFLSILENIWWKLDVALDFETLYWSAALGAAEAADAKPVGPTWMQCALEGKCSKCDFISRWDKAGSKWRQKLEYVAWTQSRNAEGKLTGFVEIIALAKAPMALEDWQNLFAGPHQTVSDDKTTGLCRLRSGVRGSRHKNQLARGPQAATRL
jgi:hypothetical protein